MTTTIQVKLKSGEPTGPSMVDLFSVATFTERFESWDGNFQSPSTLDRSIIIIASPKYYDKLVHFLNAFKS